MAVMCSAFSQFALSWSHKVEDVFSGIVEHDQIRGIF